MEAVSNSTSYGVEQDSHKAAPNMDKTAFDISAVAEYFCNRFLQDNDSDEFIAMFLHPQDAACPYCKTRIASARAIKSFYSLKRGSCKHCGKWFTATTETILQGCHNPRAVFLIAVFSAVAEDTAPLGKLLDMHPDSIRQWQKKFRAFEKL